MLLGGDQRAGGRARPAAGYFRGAAASLRRDDGQVTAVDAVVGAAVDGDARRLDTLDILHRARSDVVHPTGEFRLDARLSARLSRLPLSAT